MDVYEAIRKKRPFEIDIRTKLLALTYSAWSEAQFTQIVYTPDAFTNEQIDTMLKDSGIFNKWKILIKYSFKKTEDYYSKELKTQIQILKDSGNQIEIAEAIKTCTDHKTELQNKKDNITQYLENYIDKQSKIRNKIAHGQWINTLKPSNKEIDESLKIELNKLNVVLIMREFEVHTTLGKIIRDLVQSPNKGFDKNYQKNIDNLEKYLDKTALWNVESLEQDLKKSKPDL